MKSVEVAQPIGNKSLYFVSIILTGNYSHLHSVAVRIFRCTRHVLALFNSQSQSSAVSTVRNFAFRHYAASFSEAVKNVRNAFS